ncbi:MAG: hypothetical protein AB8B69_23165 [Chitinophagales bacterium]
MSQILFKEKQTFQKGKVILSAALTLVTAVFFLQLLLTSSYEKTGVLVGGILSVGYLAGMTYYLWKLRLKTTVSNKSIKFKYAPIHDKKQVIKPNEVADYKVVKTPLLAKMSGWDVHFNTREEIYSLSGRTGLELTLKDGQHIFIGSQKPAVLKNALDKLFGKVEVA